MKWLALTDDVATWLRGKAGAIEQIFLFLSRLHAGELQLTPGKELSAGTMRLALSLDSSTLALWGADYLSGTGEEAWGFVMLNGDDSLFGGAMQNHVILERFLHIADQRLHGLRIDGAVIPRVWEGGVHTCLAGRGSEARQYSLGYFERHVGDASGAIPALLCVGPTADFRRLCAVVLQAAGDLPELVQIANSLIVATRVQALPYELPQQMFAEIFKPYFEEDHRADQYANVEITVQANELPQSERKLASLLTYNQWIAVGSPLSQAQRRILESDAILRHPLRIVGPAGSGKSLLMQLLALRRMKLAESSGEPLRLLYVAHNSEMVRSVRQNFEILLADSVLSSNPQAAIEVKTLSDVSRDRLEVGIENVIDADAEEAKRYQREVVLRHLRSELAKSASLVENSPLLKAVTNDDLLVAVFATLIVGEISVAIKGQGLQQNRRRYVESEKAFSRLHGFLSSGARDFVFDVFEAYHQEVFEEYSMLDTDDLAISLLGKLRTPIWDLRRREQGYDFVFVDETQLFNENERRIFSLLCKPKQHVPIVLALDEAQSVFGQSSAGLASLGIENVASESLPSVHRSTKAIVDLAFFVVQHCGDLFGPDFPDFTRVSERFEPVDHPLAAAPCIEVCGAAQPSFGKFVRKRVTELRKANLRQIAIIVHGGKYWDEVREALAAADLPFIEVLVRGEKLPASAPVVALAKPEYVGGQEFDAVIAVGLEQGLVPPLVSTNEALKAALEQQAFREIYLSITRARFRVIFAMSAGSRPTSILQSAMNAGLVKQSSTAINPMQAAR